MEEEEATRRARAADAIGFSQVAIGKLERGNQKQMHADPQAASTTWGRAHFVWGGSHRELGRRGLPSFPGGRTWAPDLSDGAEAGWTHGYEPSTRRGTLVAGQSAPESEGAAVDV